MSRILLEWWQALSQGAKNVVLRPATANVNKGSPMITLVECLYIEFVGKLDDHVGMAKEAFYIAQMRDFNSIQDFVNYCKLL